MASSASSSSSSSSSQEENPNASKAASGAYIPPSWSTMPGTEFKIEVLKDGSIAEIFVLDKKPYYILGRQDDICDIVLAHPSSSRQHAVLQHGPNSELFLYDLGSTHKSFVNKKQIAPKEYVQVRVGDMLRFGQSNRLYVVCGPESLMPEEVDMEALKRQKKERQAQMLQMKLRAQLGQKEDDRGSRAAQPDVEANGISWGFGEDAEGDEDEEADVEDQFLDLDEIRRKKDLTARQTQLLDKLDTKRTKLNNLVREIDRIEAKEAGQGGLTAGQTKQVQLNQKQRTDLMEEIDELEENLRASLKQQKEGKDGDVPDSTQTNKNKKKKGFMDDEEDDASSDEDDFYDRSSKRKSKHKGAGAAKENVKVETYDSLLQQVTAIEAQQKDIADQLRLLDNPTLDADQALDPLDAFMSSNQAQIQRDKRRHLEQRSKQLSQELVQVQALLKIAAPALMKEAIRPPQEPQQQKPPSKQLNAEPTTDSSSIGSSMAPPPPLTSKTQKREREIDSPSQITTEPTIESSTNQDGHAVSETATGMEIDQPAPVNATADPMPPPTIEPKSTGSMLPPPAKKKKVYGAVAKPLPQLKSKQTNGVDPTKESTWVPPENQSGDGRTRLNDKFGY
eukprot:GILK01007583.1.p1 GENE.GILK01007583.1~~GILK01007583.1.p1  ORF type:complete len:637 (+),score=166.16 GILK01007583.1:54-1913(+)